MGKKVYANGMEVAHKSGDAHVIAAFPDVCLSPPPPPTGPVPVPYPNTSFAKDLQQGSSSVLIGGKPLALKGQSYYATSPLGDEAATRNFGGAVITHTITGKTYFQAHSMDVKVEGKFVCRHLDLATSNHASDPPSTPPTSNLESSAQSTDSTDAAKPKCDCCGKDAHSANQAAGNEISEKDFYSPQPADGSPPPHFAGEASALLAEVRSGPCKNLLPPAKPTSKTKCNKYYITRPSEKRGIEARWDDYRGTYYRKFKVQRSTDIGHRVPKAAGGCPTGPGNLTPTKPECVEVEAKLSDIQKRAVTYHRRRLGLLTG